MRRIVLGWFAALVLCGCEPKPPEGTGGVLVEESFGANGASCGRGIAVGMIDPESYASINVALLGLDGGTLSGSFISSASAPSSLNAALSGDVVFPSSRMKSDIVLIDRLVVSVLSFVDVPTAEVRAQISVRTGFESNPQDYIELDDGTALVSRLETNRSPGEESYDEGDDLLRLDVKSGVIQGRVDLSAYASESTGRARPSTMVRTDEHVLVALTRHSSTFQEAGEGALLVLHARDGEIAGIFPISGLKNCSGLALSPDQKSLAVSCGGLVSNANGAAPEGSGVVVFDLSGEKDGPLELEERHRIVASELGFGPFSSSVSFASEELVWVKTYGALEGSDAGRPDRIVALFLEEGTHEVLLESKEKAFTLGDFLCVAPCGFCMVADAGRGVLHRYGISGTEIAAPTRHRVAEEIGLPPLLLGWF
jgi:hypothetical protein